MNAFESLFFWLSVLDKDEASLLLLRSNIFCLIFFGLKIHRIYQIICHTVSFRRSTWISFFVTVTVCIGHATVSIDDTAGTALIASFGLLFDVTIWLVMDGLACLYRDASMSNNQARLETVLHQFLNIFSMMNFGALISMRFSVNLMHLYRASSELSVQPFQTWLQTTVTLGVLHYCVVGLMYAYLGHNISVSSKAAVDCLHGLTRSLPQIAPQKILIWNMWPLNLETLFKLLKPVIGQLWPIVESNVTKSCSKFDQ